MLAKLVDIPISELHAGDHLIKNLEEKFPSLGTRHQNSMSWLRYHSLRTLLLFQRMKNLEWVCHSQFPVNV